MRNANGDLNMSTIGTNAGPQIGNRRQGSEAIVAGGSVDKALSIQNGAIYFNDLARRRRR